MSHIRWDTDNACDEVVGLQTGESWAAMEIEELEGSSSFKMNGSPYRHASKLTDGGCSDSGEN
jgi:hypothetical protein